MLLVMATPQFLPVLSALKHLSTRIDELTRKIDDMQHQINQMEEEWRHEYELEYETGTDGEETESIEECSQSESESDLSVQSAPATFSYKRQRTD